MFNPKDVDINLLSARAYNLRWATVPKGVIPLTAADPDFPIAPPIKEALLDYVRGGYLSGMPRDEAEVQLKEMCRSGKLTTWETERTKLYLSTVKLEQGFV